MSDGDVVTLGEFDAVSGDVFVPKTPDNRKGKFHIYQDCGGDLVGKDPAVLFDDMKLCNLCRRRLLDVVGVPQSDDETVAWWMEVKGPMSGDWTVHIFEADKVPDDPRGAWRDDHEVRNARPLTWADEEDHD